MNRTTATKRRLPFDFVIEELAPLRPIVKQAFGFVYVYLDDTLLLALRDSVKQPATNGMWLFTSREHVDNLAREFPELSRRQIWRSGKNCWIVLASRLEYFEEYALKACELILNGDRRIGRVTNRTHHAPRRSESAFPGTKNSGGRERGTNLKLTPGEF
ncbi:MAG TPA: hypothetical protein VJU86_18345 [Pyrinomonadaceae bacterium]|nr:hypothetical protein [Pyrinomonadaceae bacterium]